MSPENASSEEILLSEHILYTFHTSEFDKTKKSTKIPNYYHRVVRESCELRKNPFTVHRNNSVDISDACW